MPGSEKGVLGFLRTAEVRPPCKLGRPSCPPSPASSLDHPSPDVRIWSLRPGRHSPCHSGTLSGVRVAVAPSAQPSGVPSSSSDGSNSSIANHWACRAPRVFLAPAAPQPQRPALRRGRQKLSALLAPPLLKVSPPLGPETHSVTPVATVCDTGLRTPTLEIESRRGLHRPTHSGLEKKEEEKEEEENKQTEEHS